MSISITKIDENTNKLYAWLKWHQKPSSISLALEVNTIDIINFLETNKINCWHEETDIIPGINNETNKVSTLVYGDPAIDTLYVQFTRTLMTDYDEENPEESTNELIDFCTDFEIVFKEKTTLVDEIVEFILENQLENIDIGRFFMVSAGPQGFYLTPTKVVDMDLDIPLHYGDDFEKKHNNIVKSIIEGNKGIYLFHGDPGTGKTTYLRYLISIISKEKNVIYLPSFMMWNITNPEFISFLQANKGSVLILEDAEAVLQKRDGQYNDQAVSNILNISDGLLNDATGMQIIATFNANKTQLDPAIMRTGRLMQEHEFKELSAENATILSAAIDKNIIYSKSTTIAEVYNGDNSEKKITKKKRVGFNKD